jgi:NAD(P)-dependent dehydrogenase (short-subunit alcohol dehydrogenase family)
MNIQNSVALVTGFERGLGREFILALLGRGAKKVYAASSISGALDLPGVERVELDVSKSTEIAAACDRCRDVNLLINGTGAPAGSPWPGADSADPQGSFSCTSAMCRTFATLIENNGGGAIVNVISVQSLPTASGGTSYGAAKATAWCLTNVLRLDLTARGTEITDCHVGFMDADVVRPIDAVEFGPDDVALETLIVLEAANDRSVDI